MFKVLCYASKLSKEYYIGTYKFSTRTDAMKFSKLFPYCEVWKYNYCIAKTTSKVLHWYKEGLLKQFLINERII